MDIVFIFTSIDKHINETSWKVRGVGVACLILKC